MPSLLEYKLRRQDKKSKIFNTLKKINTWCFQNFVMSTGLKKIKNKLPYFVNERKNFAINDK